MENNNRAWPTLVYQLGISRITSVFLTRHGLWQTIEKNMNDVERILEGFPNQSPVERFVRDNTLVATQTDQPGAVAGDVSGADNATRAGREVRKYPLFCSRRRIVVSLTIGW